MAVAVARLFLLIVIWLHAVALVSSLPTTGQPSNLLVPRAPVIATDLNGNLTVVDPNTRQRIPQGPATDGGGSGFDIPAVMWIVFTALVGLPLAAAGIRGWRVTTGAAIGLGSVVCAWAAMINSVTEVGIPDMFLTLICFGIFVIGFGLGCFEFSRIGATLVLTLLGGLAVGIRVVLVKDDLLLSSRNLFAVNWVIAAAFAVIFAFIHIWSRRVAILLATSSVGTFLSSLSADLVVNKQAGLSRGLRFLFDRNTNHLLDILNNGYKPPLSTRIIIFASLALIPAFAFAQHKFFKAPFNRNPQDDGILGDHNLEEEEKGGLARITGFWDSSKDPSRRFSL